MTTRGKFITFEGIDGAGKSSHIAAVVDYIKSNGKEVISTREPGGTPVGESIRELVLNTKMGLETEAMLMFAARREHITQLIDPALARGDWVVCDRFTDSSHAYQCGGRGIHSWELHNLEHWTTGSITPDLTFLFDLPVTVAFERLIQQGRKLDKFETEKFDFHNRVRESYLELAQAYPGRIAIVDAQQSIESIRWSVLFILENLFVKSKAPSDQA